MKSFSKNNKKIQYYETGVTNVKLIQKTAVNRQQYI